LVTRLDTLLLSLSVTKRRECCIAQMQMINARCTVDFEMGAVRNATSWTVGNACVLPGVFAPYRRYGKGRDSISHSGYMYLIVYFNSVAVEEPLKRQRRISFNDSAMHYYQVAGVGAFVKHKGLKVRCDCKIIKTTWRM
jgi:hypothetical protein